MPFEINLSVDAAEKETGKLITAVNRLTKALNTEVKAKSATDYVKKLAEEVKRADSAVKQLKATVRAAIKIKVDSRDLLTAQNRAKSLAVMAKDLRSHGDAVKFVVDASSAKIATVQINSLNRAVARTIELSKKPMTINTGSTSELRQINTSITDLSLKLKQLAEGYNKSATEARKHSDALEKDANASKKLADQHKKTVTEVKKGTAANVEMHKSLVDKTQAAAMFRAGLLASGHSMGLFTAHTLVAAVAVYSLVKAISAVISVGANFTRSLAETAAIMGTSRENLAGLTKQMMDLAETTKFTTTQVSDAATILAKTGMKQSQLVGSLPAVLNLAAIGSMDMAKAADIASNAMFGFGLQAKDMEMVVDTLAFTAIRSNTSVVQLGTAMSYVAPLASAAGASIKEVASMMAVMTNAGVKGSRLGTTMRRAFANLLGPTDKVKTIFSDLGVEIQDVNTGEIDMIRIMKELTEAGVNIPDLKEIFGVRAAPGMIALWKDVASAIQGGASTLYDVKKGLEDVQGTAEVVRDKMEKNLIDTWLKFTSVLSVKATQAFLRVEKRMVSAVKTMTKYVRETLDVNVAVDKSILVFKSWTQLFKDMDKLPDHIRGAKEAIEDLSSLLKKAGATFDTIDFGNPMADFAENITLATQIITIKLAQIVSNFASWKIELAIIQVKVSTAFTLMGLKMSKGFEDAMNPVFNWFSEKLLAMADAAKAVKLTGMARELENMGNSMFNKRSTDAANAVTAAEIGRTEALALLNAELIKTRNLQRAQIGQGDDLIQIYYEQRQAKLDLRAATLAANAAERDAQLNKGGEAPGADRLDPRNVRQPYRGLETTAIKKITADYKVFIKEQRRGLDVSSTQLAVLESMKDISPYEALISDSGLAENSLSALTREYEEQLIILSEGAVYSAGITRASKMQEFVQEIKKLTEAYDAEAAALNRVITAQTAAARTMVRDEATTVKSELGSGQDRLDEDLNNQLTSLVNLYSAQEELQISHQDKAYISAADYQNRLLQIQIASAASQAELWGGHHTGIFNFAESVRADDLAGMLSNGSAMLDGAAQQSKKAFEAQKAVNIAQAVMSTYAGMSKALEWGWPMGPIFAALIAANGFASVNAIRATSFNGGGTVASPSTAAPTIPAAPLDSTALDDTSRGVTINIDGNLYANDDFRRAMVEALELAESNDEIRILNN